MKPGVWITSSWSAHNGNCVQAAWWKSSHSASNGHCVEVAAAGVVLVRDSKDRQGPMLRFTPAEWRTFLASLGR